MEEAETAAAEHIAATVKTTDKRLLFLLLAFVSIGALLGWRIQQNQDDIRDSVHNQAVYNWEQCQRSVINTTKINEKDEALIRLLVKFGKPDSPPIIQWIKDTRDAHLTIPSCGPRPK